MKMIRKQLYLTEKQDVALKHKAQEAGVSEAELVRRVLDAALNTSTTEALRPGQREAAAQLRTTWVDSSTRLSKPFDRTALYEVRTAHIASKEHR